ncbi:ABC transporter ATP-binding protein [Mongoliitalea daihaiensis]|uniref:ABC transporter ATP-binding protein n=1 Tax=Mongoliitalea daihaiensis TaxID=2782006 RepID=UPI001F46A0D9|nr:ATP-binding cassette domain-containing protein [Mongoliitalea daihaiensis]UJP64996.1 ATP-binding cassette domain-containing protein [Mongoliitalea daihaiensis]
MLTLKNVEFKYNTSDPFQIPDISLESGGELLILGKSGSGKTTILNIIAGLLKPQKGTVVINGVEIYQLSGSQLDKFRGTHIGIIFQKPHILSALSVEENLKIANYFVSGKGLQNEQILKDLGIWDKRNQRIQTLSEGEAQRVSIARALANQPKLILADEPTASLDDDNAEKVIRLLQYQASQFNAALVIVTHDQRVKNHIANHITIGGTR